jgi:hypothetical protein
MNNSFSGNWLQARQKINEGKDYTTKTPVPFGDETIEITHRLLTEGELMAVQSNIDQEALLEHRTDGESDAEQRLRELQEKEDLTDAEERELQEVGNEVQRQKAGIMNSLGKETYDAFMAAGKKALVPSEDDVDDAFALDPSEQERIFGKVLTHRKEAKDLLKSDMRNSVEDQPYPIKYIIGQAAYGESMKLLGDEEDIDLGN